MTQNPIDVPDRVLGQLGNRVQHAVRAFTPNDQKAVHAAAQTFRANPAIDVEQVILNLGVGEALVSFLDEKGAPAMVERALVCPPHSQIGPITAEQRQQIMRSSVVAGVYDTAVDNESAYELLQARALGSAPAQAAAQSPAQAAAQSPAQPAGAPAASTGGSWLSELASLATGSSSNRRGDTLVQTMAKSAARTLGSTVGRQIVRGVLGSLLGGTTSRRR